MTGYPVEGWDVPRGYYAPDEPTAYEEATMSEYERMADEIEAAEREFRPALSMEDALIADGEKLRQLGENHGPHPLDALLNDLRESVLLERAKVLYRIAHNPPGSYDQAIDTIRNVLRITRDEGIAVGLDQATRHAQQIEAVA